MHTGPFSRIARPLSPAMEAEMAALARRLGAPIVRDVALDDVAFDPVGNPSRFAEVTRTLAAACSLLQRAAVLFTRAATHGDAGMLVRAGHVASSAGPLLVRAKVRLQAAATSR